MIIFADSGHFSSTSPTICSQIVCIVIIAVEVIIIAVLISYLLWQPKPQDDMRPPSDVQVNYNRVSNNYIEPKQHVTKIKNSVMCEKKTVNVMKRCSCFVERQK